MLNINNMFGIDGHITFPTILKFKNADEKKVRESFYLIFQVKGRSRGRFCGSFFIKNLF